MNRLKIKDVLLLCLQKMQRKLREQGKKVKRSEEELHILKRTRKEVDDIEALWKGMSIGINLHLQSDFSGPNLQNHS